MKTLFSIVVLTILLLFSGINLTASTTPKIDWNHVIPYNQDSLLAIQGMQVISTSDGGCLVSVQSELSLPIFSKYSSTGTNEWFRFRPLDVHKELFSNLKLSYTFNSHQLLEKDEEYLMYSFYHIPNPFGDIGNLGTAYVVKNSTEGIGELMLSQKDEDKLINVVSIKPIPNGNVLIASNPTSALYNILSETRNGFNLLPKKFTYRDSERIFTIPLSILDAEDSSRFIFNAGASSLYTPDGKVTILKIKDTNLIGKIEFDRTITGETSYDFAYSNAHYTNGIFYLVGNLKEKNSNNKRAFLIVIDTNKTLINFTKYDLGTVVVGSSLSKDNDQVSLVGWYEKTPSKRQFFATRFNTSNFFSNSYTWNLNEGSDDRLMKVAYGKYNELFVTGGSNSDCYTAKLQNEPITSVSENLNNSSSILYPNPTSGILNFSPSVHTNYTSLELYDMFNRMVRTIRFDQYNSTVLSVEQLSQGVYTAVFKGINGNKVEKIVIHR
ncbi:MAG: T9SS type A sorting domain-containing protein [Candidatus Kapabacteria bacterium]|nr:T9SS type A sorting domain-containing protein [Candidatus Kapabacteria bacterium]